MPKREDCRCACHSSPGMIHFVPCCDSPAEDEAAPEWTKECPIAYADYRVAYADLERILKEAGVADSVCKTAGVCLAQAWTAGQNSIAEKAAGHGPASGVGFIACWLSTV